MTKLIRGVFALLLVVFLSACSTEEEKEGEKGKEGGKGIVAMPSIRKNPNQAFNNEPIQITLSTATEGASIYYTTDGTAPTATSTKYTIPFNLEPKAASPGTIQLQVIGIKEGMYDSSVNRQNFQIFQKELIKSGDGQVISSASASGIGEGGMYSDAQRIQVNITVVEGIISAEYVNGYNGTPSHTSEYWNTATKHANQFLSTMNSWEFDTGTGATYTSWAIKQGLTEAMDEILKK